MKKSLAKIFVIAVALAIGSAVYVKREQLFVPKEFYVPEEP
jgi:hypothetical protein